MTGRIAAGLSPIALALVLVLAACGGTSAAPLAKTVRVYFLRDGKVAPVARNVTAVDPAAGAREALEAGPTARERAIGLTTAPRGTPAARAQAAYTESQFPGYDGPPRSAFEDLTPAILVESPLPFETVRSPLRSSGTANTFEATFEYELRDASGRVLASHFVTATSGSGTRGTFEFEVPFSVERSGPGTLVVYEISAANGKRIHVVEIPIRLEG